AGVSPFGSRIELSPDAYALALSYDKLNSPAGKEAAKKLPALPSTPLRLSCHDLRFRTFDDAQGFSFPSEADRLPQL
ncbi:hypothetical protein ACC736_40195, partial [Rhizobium ruizarguesonis]